jgi:hypothetical protein
MTSTLETTDIFRGAFYLCCGGRLEDIRFNEDGGRIASFMFIGQDLDEHDRAYRDGQALVNPVQFRESLNHLRDILFTQIRDRRRSEYVFRSKDPAAGGNRTRENRPHQDIG